MKNALLPVLFSLTLLVAQGQREGFPGTGSSVLRVTGTRLVHPIFRKWIGEYTRLHPGLTILLDNRIPADSADLVIASHILDAGDLKPGQGSVILNRYVQLPLVSSRRSDAAVLQGKGFTDADFKKIYFAGSDPAGTEKDDVATGNGQPIATRAVYHFTVYKREKSACASRAFANHFGNQQKDINGIGVKGDDLDLLNEVIRDTNGISYNNLGFLYDLKTRKPVDGIAIIPLDLDGNGRVDPRENFYGNLDSVIRFSEKSEDSHLLVEDVHVIFSTTRPRPELAGFLQWILTEGQQYDHAYGFLVPGRKTLADQRQIVSRISKQ